MYTQTQPCGMNPLTRPLAPWSLSRWHPWPWHYHTHPEGVHETRTELEIRSFSLQMCSSCACEKQATEEIRGGLTEEKREKAASLPFLFGKSCLLFKNSLLPGQSVADLGLSFNSPSKSTKVAQARLSGEFSESNPLAKSKSHQG